VSQTKKNTTVFLHNFGKLTPVLVILSQIILKWTAEEAVTYPATFL